MARLIDLLTFSDGFANPDGTRHETLPETAVRVTSEAIASGADMTIASRYATAEALQEVLAMGMEEGIKGALSQVDAISPRSPDRHTDESRPHRRS